MQRGVRYYRQIAATVLQRYAEVETGHMGNEFDERLLNYRMDVEKALLAVSPKAQQVLLAIHRDGLSQEQACAQAGIGQTRPDSLVLRFEYESGKRFDRAGLSDIEKYLA